MPSVIERAHEQQWMTRREAAKRLGVSIDTICRWVQTGCLIAYRPHERATLISAQSVEEWEALRRGGLDEPSYRTTQAAAVLGVSREALWNWGRAGRLRIVRVSPKRSLVPVSDVKRLLAQRRGRKESMK
jgi:excisionase family DNA binding protein